MASRLDDILTRWKSKGDITDAEYAMGLRVRGRWEGSRQEGHAAFRLDRLDTGRGLDTWGKQLNRIGCEEDIGRLFTYLGQVDAPIILDVIGEGRSLEDVSKAWGIPGGREHIGARVRYSLRWLCGRRWGGRDEVIPSEASIRARS